MKLYILTVVLFAIPMHLSWGVETLLIHQQHKCTHRGAAILESRAYIISRALCENHWTLWLSRGSDENTSVVVDKVKLKPLTKSQKLDDSFYCYFRGKKTKRLEFYGIFDFNKKGSIKNKAGKLIEAYVPDIKKEKLVALSPGTLNKVVCESESD